MLPVENLPGLLETALRSPEPGAALQKLGAYLMEMGAERSALMPALEEFHARLLTEGREDDADHIAGLIDGFTGWCRLE